MYDDVAVTGLVVSAGAVCGVDVCEVVVDDAIKPGDAGKGKVVLVKNKYPLTPATTAIASAPSILGVYLFEEFIQLLYYEPHER